MSVSRSTQLRPHRKRNHMPTFDPQSDIGFPKPGIPQLTVFSLVHRVKHDDSDIYDSATDLLG